MENPRFGQKVAELRNAKGYSQYQLAMLTGVTFQAVSKWETKGTVPRRTTCEKLSSLLGYDFDIIINEDLPPDEADKLIGDQKKLLWAKAETRMKELYGEEPPLQVENRFILERNMLHRGKSIILFDILAEIRKAAKKKPARFDASGCECFVSWLLGATDVNPLEPHLRCPKCRRMEFHPEVQSGWDLKGKTCECGGRMEPDGQDIPVETCLLGEGDLYENFRCSVDTDFLDEAERIILTCGEQFFTMEKYREEAAEEYETEPESGKPVIDPETGKKIRIQHLPMSALMFRPKKKARIRKPEKISGPSELINWGRRTGQPVIVLMGGCYEPSYLLKPSPFTGSPEELVRQGVMERALKDYWKYHSAVMEQYSDLQFPDLTSRPDRLTFSTFVTLLCSVNNLYMGSGPEELAEKTGHSDLTELPLSMEDLWKLICRSTAYPGYMSGAAGEILRKTRMGHYLSSPYQAGIQPRDRKLFREMNLPEWFEIYVSDLMSLCYRAPYISLGILLLEDARRKIREGK